MRVDRRKVLTGGAAFAIGAAVTPAPAAASSMPQLPRLRNTAVFVPGYFPDRAFANGKILAKNRRFTRGLDNHGGVRRMLTRLGMDGSVRQTLLPVSAHDVEIAPDRSVGVLCAMDGRDHCAFDPETLELAAVKPSFHEGWRGGGHAVYLDGGRLVVLSERAPDSPYQGRLEPHFGRLTIREPKTLKTVDSYSTYGIDPHDIRLTQDGRHIVIANYGSTVSPKTAKHSVPRNVVEAAITVVELASGKLVDKRRTGRGKIELRHLAAGGLDRIFAIQARLGSEAEDRRQMSGEDVAYQSDITAYPGENYLAAATLKYDASKREVTTLGGRAATRLMRHGLSIRYDTGFDEVITTYPSSHQVMVFGGEDGELRKRLDTRSVGLRYPCGVAFLPDGKHYAVTGYWENLFVFERGSHRLVRDLCLYPLFFGHSHIAAA